VIRGLSHQVEDGLLCPNHTVAFKLGPRINPDDKWLGIRFLLIAQLDVEEA
jgi:hypothetical protein